MIVKLQQKEGIKKFKITSNLHFRVIQISSFNQFRLKSGLNPIVRMGSLTLIW